MLMNNGARVPGALTAALAGGGQAATIFAGMRPSCQRRHAGYVAQAQTETGAQSRAHSTLNAIHEYGQRHGIASHGAMG